MPVAGGNKKNRRNVFGERVGARKNAGTCKKRKGQSRRDKNKVPTVKP